MSKTDEQKRLQQLRKTVTYHAKKYHEEQAPEISDEAYDALLHEVIALEEQLEGTRTSAAENFE